MKINVFKTVKNILPFIVGRFLKTHKQMILFNTYFMLIFGGMSLSGSLNNLIINSQYSGFVIIWFVTKRLSIALTPKPL